MKQRSAIIVYVNTDGVDKMIEHILDGSQRQHNPSLTVGSSLYGVHIPMMTRDGKVEEHEQA